MNVNKKVLEQLELGTFPQRARHHRRAAFCVFSMPHQTRATFADGRVFRPSEKVRGHFLGLDSNPEPVQVVGRN